MYKINICIKYFPISRGGPGHIISVWLKIIGAIGKKLFIVIILVKQQTIHRNNFRIIKLEI
jgi:hypothetical protein